MPGAASRWWLHQSLAELGESLRSIGSRLILRGGDPAEELEAIVRETKAAAVFCNRRYEPHALQEEQAVRRALQKLEPAVQFESLPGSLLFEPEEVHTRQFEPYRVFTPFYKSCMAQLSPVEAEPAPSRMKVARRWPKSKDLEALRLEPVPNWADGLREAWQPGEAGARKRLTSFLDDALGDYTDQRDRPDARGTSELSPHLHFGEISVRHVWSAVEEWLTNRRSRARESAEAFRRQLIWREFAHHLLFHFPHTTDQPLRAKFAEFPWAQDDDALQAWQGGRTGYPIVDAGMRQLWAIGWMHNRVRMAVASFLVKDLLIPWQEGARWFWDTLVDADLANNTLGWQWTAGCGADAAPYFRIFNPVRQGERFDPDGEYVRTWVPEVARLPARHIHAPWEAPEDVLSEAGVRLGEDYPEPIVDHARARKDALKAYEKIKA